MLLDFSPLETKKNSINKKIIAEMYVHELLPKLQKIMLYFTLLCKNKFYI